MESMDVLTKARESMNAKTVFAEPITHDGLIVVPAARISGGAGGGTGQGKDQATTGEGGGFGLRSAPVGAFVIKDGSVSWRPALDLNKVILGGQVVAIVALLAARSIIRTLAKRRAFSGVE